MTTPTTSIEAALEQLRTGRPVLVADDADRENEVDAILAAELATPRWVGWAVRHSSGYLCAPMPDDLADRLALPLMVPRTQDSLRTAYTISVDATEGVTTGISATDRARTLRVLADPAARPVDLIRPGHVIPLRAVAGGVRARAGHTEAAVDLCRAAGLAPVGMIGELVRDDGEVMRLSEARALADAEGLVVITIADLRSWLEARADDASAAGDRGTAGAVAAAGAGAAESSADRVEHLVSARMPTRHGEFVIHGYRDLRTGAEHVALVAAGEAPAGSSAVLVRIHSECLTGEAFGSARCECGPQLDAALARVAESGGAVVYLRGHEGRGIGLLEKLVAYDLQDRGRDTLEANLDLGWPGDLREYGAAAAILRDLGIDRVALLTNNPDKAEALAAHGILVEERVGLVVGRTAENLDYLRTKAHSMGHLIPSEALEDVDPAAVDPPAVDPAAVDSAAAPGATGPIELIEPADPTESIDPTEPTTERTPS